MSKSSDHSGDTNPTGKTRFNALTHGMTSRQPLIPGEDNTARETLLESWHQSFPPASGYDASLIAAAADSEWLLRRVERGYDASSHALFKTPMEDWSPDQHAQFLRITRYLTAYQRTLDRHRRAVLQNRREIRSEARTQLTQTSESTPKPEPRTSQPIHQYIDIYQRDGRTRSFCQPSNESVLLTAKQRLPETIVLRYLRFGKRFIPPEYAWAAPHVAALPPNQHLLLLYTVASLPTVLEREYNGHAQSASHAQDWPDIVKTDWPLVSAYLKQREENEKEQERKPTS